MVKVLIPTLLFSFLAAVMVFGLIPPAMVHVEARTGHKLNLLEKTIVLSD